MQPLGYDKALFCVFKTMLHIHMKTKHHQGEVTFVPKKNRACPVSMNVNKHYGKGGKVCEPTTGLCHYTLTHTVTLKYRSFSSSSFPAIVMLLFEII